MVDLTPVQLTDKLVRVAQAAHAGAYKGMQVACLARQATAMKYCTSGSSPFDPMIFPTKQGGTGAPIDTGNLRAHIYMMVEDKNDEIVGGVGCGDQGKGTASVDGYAGHVHNGTSKMQARPFIELALTNEEADTKKRISEGTWNAITQAALL
jgi:hypothetical protein